MPISSIFRPLTHLSLIHISHGLGGIVHAHHAGVDFLFVLVLGAYGRSHRAMVHQGDTAAVSYTHLDVYKRQGYHTRNFTYAQLCIGTILGRIIVGKLFRKPYYDYKVVSIYEYLEKRFGLLTRRTAYIRNLLCLDGR